MRYLCAFRGITDGSVVVLDTKGRINWTGYRLVKSFKSLTKLDPKKDRRLIYRPDFNAVKNWNDGDDEIERFFEWVFRRGNTTLYIDEAYMVTRGEQMPQYYHGCLTQGRELGIETWTATQRPISIPQVLQSEPEHVYVFKLRLEQDRKKIESTCGVSESAIAALKKRDFLYSVQSGGVTGPYSIDLTSRRT